MQEGCFTEWRLLHVFFSNDSACSLQPAGNVFKLSCQALHHVYRSKRLLAGQLPNQRFDARQLQGSSDVHSLFEQTAPNKCSTQNQSGLHGGCVAVQEEGIPNSLLKAKTAAERLRWLMSRVSLSRTNEGVGRGVVQKVVEHWWAVEGERLCATALSEILAEEGGRASGDHTYGCVRNLCAYDENGKPTALRASLLSVLGQGVVLGFKVCHSFP